jgi:ABC-type transport system substrate-binding protein
MSSQVSGSISPSIKVGPYVDKIVYDVIANQDQRIIALQNGDIEMDSSFFDPVHLPEINADPEINVFTAVRNGYGHYTINCGKYPLNISGLRRAFAYAFDKEAYRVEVMDCFSRSHDSLVPRPMDWCIEDELDWHYYTAQPDIGNAILDDLGFVIDPGTGFRLAPNGSAFNIVLEYASGCSNPGGAAQMGVDALHSLHIDARTGAADFNEYIERLDNHGDYDIVFYAVNFEGNDIRWLADEYWSENADVYGKNPTNFENLTYDSWREQLLYGATYEEVFEAAAEMQRILHYNVPRLVIYMNTYNQAYRIDQFTGHVEDLTRYISGPWTTRNIRMINGSFGGTVNLAFSQEPDSFNIFETDSRYSNIIFENLYSSLYDYGPDMESMTDLARELVTKTHSEDPSIPDGHLRFTIDIIQNATWSDGTPLTAEDVSFTFNYLYDANITHLQPTSDLYGVWAPTQYRVVFEFSTESYWHFPSFAYNKIIPKHIFNEVTGIGYEDWIYWNPGFDPAEPHVTSGPFMLTDFDAGEFYELTYNPEFYYAPDRTTPTTTTDTTDTTPTTSPESTELTPVIMGAALGISVAVIIVAVFEIIRRKRVE